MTLFQIVEQSFIKQKQEEEEGRKKLHTLRVSVDSAYLLNSQYGI